MAFRRFCLERARGWAAALLSWASPTRNPFVAAALRVEGRRFLALRLAFWFAVWFSFAWSVALGSAGTLANPADAGVIGAQTLIGLAVLWALLISRIRLSSALQNEWLKGRLVPILLSRLSPEEVAYAAGAPAVLLALLVVALTLPAWAFGLVLGFFGPLDAFGYVLLVAAATIGFPAWSSALWEAQVNARARAKVGVTPSTAKRKSATAAVPFSLHMSLSRALMLALVVAVNALIMVAPEPLFSSIQTWVSLWPGEITSLWGRAYAFPLLLARLLVYPLPFYALSLPLWIALAPFWVNGLRESHARLSASLEARSDSAVKRAARIAAIWRPIRGLWAPLLAGFALPVAYHSGWLAVWRGSTPMFPTKAGVEADVTLSWWHAVVALAVFTLSIWLRVRASQAKTSGEQWPTLRRRFGRASRQVAAGATLTGTLGPLLCGHNPFPTPFALLAVQMALVAGVWLCLQMAFARAQAVRSNTWPFSALPRGLAWLIWLWMWGVPLLVAAVPYLASWGTKFVNPLSWPICLLSPVTLWFAPRFENSLDSPLFYGAAIGHFVLAVAFSLYARTLPTPVERAKKAPRPLRLSPARRRKLAVSRQAEGAPLPTLQAARQATVDTLQGVLEVREKHDSPRPATADARLQLFDTLEADAPETAALRTITRSPLPAPTLAQERFLSSFTRFDNALLRLELRRTMGKIDWASNAIGGAKMGVGTIIVLSILLPCVVLFIVLLTGPATPSTGGMPVFIGMEWGFSAFVCFGLLLTGATVCQGAEALYTRDRLDGALDFLWLSPMTTREIVAGKIGPSLVRATCYFAAFWPTYLTIALLLSLAGDHRFWPFALLLPVFSAALTTRSVAWLHLSSVGKSNSKFVLFASLIGQSALPLGIGAAIIATVSTLSGDLEASNLTPLWVLGLLCIPLCLLDCWLPIAWSIRRLERERVRR